MQRLNLIPLLWETLQAGTDLNPFLQIKAAVFVCTDREIDTQCVIAWRPQQRYLTEDKGVNGYI